MLKGVGGGFGKHEATGPTDRASASDKETPTSPRYDVGVREGASYLHVRETRGCHAKDSFRRFPEDEGAVARDVPSFRAGLLFRWIRGKGEGTVEGGTRRDLNGRMSSKRNHVKTRL